MTERHSVATNKGDVAFDKRAADAHLGEVQYWTHGSTPPVTLWFAHNGRFDGDANKFFFKHFLLPAKKEGRTAEQKMSNRLAHRQSANKETGKVGSGLSWKAKYGTLTPAENTVIDLAMINPKEVTAKFVAAIGDSRRWNKAGTWNHAGRKNRVKIVHVDFGVACVRQATASGAPKNDIHVSVRRVGANDYDVYHMEGAA